ncbi:extracellular solute-binding protein [Paenibacillus lupini]|uniref:extracellular solute-binding protein n=1 Tax=Paenibacillus lupini TaxID=1450204 RepID=UPI001420CF4E|nr:extracellular solute-binding protein [Paenibacillus lupini]NIK22249.1 putative aldouronate transport system substrate-binding protein [Paenibacillus lupini]
MNNKNKVKSTAIGVMAAMMMLSACSSGGSNNENNATDKPDNNTATAATNSTEPAVDPMAKYDPPIDITAWRYTESTYQYENGDTIENNIYTKAYESDLGIKLKYQWTVPIEQFDQKLNVSIASGDLPDIMWLKNKQLTDLAENDMLYDLTDLFEKYASPITKKIMLQDEASFNTAKIGGKLMAIPSTASAVDGLPILYLRTDWLNKLNLPEPKTMDDVIKIAEAFTKNDPDGNGKPDTFGLGLTKTFMTDGQFGGSGFFSGYHAAPEKWVKDASGQLAYGSIQPEMKAALQQLQDMYKQGLLDKEFGVKDRAKVTESIVSGKLGMFYGTMSAPLSVIQENVNSDPNAEWKSFPLVSFDDQKATPIGKMPIQRYFAVSKDSKHPEAIIKLLNFSMEGFEEDAVDNGFGYSKNNIPVYLYSLISAEPAKKNLNAHLNAIAALESKDPSKLSTEEKGYYDKIVDFRGGNRENWGTERVFGSPSSFDVINQYVNDNNYTFDAFYGALTPTMVEKLSSLQKMEEEVITKIIMGQSIDTFDKFVEDWKKLGGDQITKEANEWAAKNK